MSQEPSRLHLKLLAALCVPLLIFGLLEVALRLSPWDERLGPHRFNGLREGFSLFWDPNNLFSAQHEGDALEDSPWVKRVPRVKPPGTFRIISLGGSVTFGWPYEKTPEVAYPMVLERLLNQSPPPGIKRFEVINAGVAAFSSYQGLEYFKLRLRRYKPDLVTICFGNNDAENNSETGTFLTDREYYERLRVLAQKKMVQKTRNLLNSLRAYALLEKGIFHIKLALFKDQHRVPPAEFQSNLMEFIQMAKEDGFNLMLIYEPMIIFTEPLEDMSAEDRNNPYRKAIRAVAIKNPGRVHIADTVAFFQTHQGEGEKLFVDFMHMTKRGNRVMGGFLKEDLFKSGFLK